jgi:hypothetical protein
MPPYLFKQQLHHAWKRHGMTRKGDQRGMDVNQLKFIEETRPMSQISPNAPLF